MLPCTNKGFHERKTGDAAPIKKNPFKVPFVLKAEMKKQLDDMLQRGVITPACSEWVAPVILVKKKSLDGTPKYRFCTDFRGLNTVTKIPVYPIPDINRLTPNDLYESYRTANLQTLHFIYLFNKFRD